MCLCDGEHVVSLLGRTCCVSVKEDMCLCEVGHVVSVREDMCLCEVGHVVSVLGRTCVSVMENLTL